jgi:transposase
MPLPRAKKSKKPQPRRPKATSWVELEQRLEKLEGTLCDGEIINLPGWKTIIYKETSDDIIALAELTTEAAAGCKCGATWAEMKKWGYTDPTHVRDIPVRCKRMRIYFRLQRKRCMECKKTFQQPLSCVDEKHTMLTSRLVEYIGRESFNIFRNFSGVADEVGCSEITVREIYTARALRLETGRVVEAPRWLAIDEVYPQKHKPAHCVITAPEYRRVLDLLPNNGNDKKRRGRKPGKSTGSKAKPPVLKIVRSQYPTSETTNNDPAALSRWMLNLQNRDRVEVVTIDMCAQYRSVVQRMLKNARIVVDRYHVHNMLNVALKGVLEVLRNSMTTSEQRMLMRRESLVLKNYRHLSKENKKDENGNKLPSEKDLFKRWLKNVPDLAAAYQLKKDFSDILQLSDRQKAEELTDAWLDRVCEFVKDFRGKYEKKYHGSWEDPFGNVPNTVTEWRSSILTYIDYKNLFEIKTTNAFAEFANKQIKKAFKMGNGYRFAVLRVKVVHGGVLVVKRPPHPLDQKWTRSKSDRGARRGPKSPREINPYANVVLLEKARAEQDRTIDLLPKPQETSGWTKRFKSEAKKKPVPGSDDQYLDMLEEFEIEEREVVRRGRRPFRHNSSQLKMF